VFYVTESLLHVPLGPVNGFWPKAAKKFFRKLLKRCQYVPRVLATDQLRSYGAAQREVLPSVEHRQHRSLNNRAENSHQPTRQRERRMQGFKSPGHAQRFLSAYDPIAQHFRPRRHLLPAPKYCQEMENLHFRQCCNLFFSGRGLPGRGSILNPTVTWA
jgi:hypothetical protein